MGDEGMAIGARAVVHRRAGVARRSAKLTPLGKIKLEGATDRIFFGFLPREPAEDSDPHKRGRQAPLLKTAAMRHRYTISQKGISEI